MALFLRDKHLQHLTIDAEAVRQLYEIFAARQPTAPNEDAQPGLDPPNTFLSFIIRFDNKGYRVFLLEELLSYFHRAERVERIVFTLETSQALRTNRAAGTVMELRLDAADPNNNFITVTANDRDWVDASFGALDELLSKHKNKNGFIRTAWTQLLIRILGLAFGFVVSLWAAARIAPGLAIENSFLICFLLVLLVFSNIWGYVNQRVEALVWAIFPSVRLYRPRQDRLNWLMQAVIGGVVVATTLYIIGRVLQYAGEMLGDLVGKSN